MKNLCILCFQTSVQVPAPAAGVIEELLVPDGGKVEGGTPLFKLRKGGVFNVTDVNNQRQFLYTGVRI